jgi:hypothetical protein
MNTVYYAITGHGNQYIVEASDLFEASEKANAMCAFECVCGIFTDQGAAEAMATEINENA